MNQTFRAFDFRYQTMDKVSSAAIPPDIAAEPPIVLGSLWWQHIPHSRRLGIDKTPTGIHVTRSNQGLSSLAPGGGKMRDPGNEVVNGRGYIRTVLSTASELSITLCSIWDFLTS